MITRKKKRLSEIKCLATTSLLYMCIYIHLIKNIIISTLVSFLTYPPLGCWPSVYRSSFFFPAYQTDVRNDPLLRLTSSVLLLHLLASAASIGRRQLRHLSKRHWFSSPQKIISRRPPWRRQTHSFISFPIFSTWYTHIFKHEVVSSDDSAQVS